MIDEKGHGIMDRAIGNNMIVIQDKRETLCLIRDIVDQTDENGLDGNGPGSLNLIQGIIATSVGRPGNG